MPRRLRVQDDLWWNVTAESCQNPDWQVGQVILQPRELSQVLEWSLSPSDLGQHHFSALLIGRCCWRMWTCLWCRTVWGTSSSGSDVLIKCNKCGPADKNEKSLALKQTGLRKRKTSSSNTLSFIKDLTTRSGWRSRSRRIRWTRPDDHRATAPN